MSQDLIQSELAGLAFDSLQQVFRKADIAKMFETPPLPLVLHQPVWLVIDPAGGGPQSDYAMVSICRSRGCVTVSPPPYATTYASKHLSTKAAALCASSA